MWGQRSLRGQWPLGSMTFGSFWKKSHCVHILWCIFMGLGQNDPWVESHMWPQQPWGQRSSRGQWPLVQFLVWVKSVTMIAKVCKSRKQARTALVIMALKMKNAYFFERKLIFWLILPQNGLFWVTKIFMRHFEGPSLL